MPEQGPERLVQQSCEPGVHFIVLPGGFPFTSVVLCPAHQTLPSLQQHDLETTKLSQGEHGSTNSIRVVHSLC